MTESAATQEPREAGMRITWISTLLLLVIAGTVLSVDALAHSDWLLDRVTAWELSRFERGESFYPHRGNFLEFEDRLLLEEIPEADRSRGGVYFFGSSDLKWGLKTWELPGPIRRYVGNYGLGAVNHTYELQFIRYLVEHEDLLQAGGERNLVVLGASHTNVFEAEGSLATYFARLWPRHGLYTYDPDTGIRPADMPALARSLRVRKARWSGFLGGHANRAARLLVETLGVSVSSGSSIAGDREAVTRKVRRMHRRWEEELPGQIEELGRLLEYLQARDVRVAVVLLPHRRYLDALPVISAYREAVIDLCAARSVPVTDLSHLLEDDEFHDVSHANARGLARIHARLMEVAMPHLRAIGVAAPR